MVMHRGLRGVSMSERMRKNLREINPPFMKAVERILYCDDAGSDAERNECLIRVWLEHFKDTTDLYAIWGWDYIRKATGFAESEMKRLLRYIKDDDNRPLLHSYKKDVEESKYGKI
jgi:hypothetical protein